MSFLRKIDEKWSRSVTHHGHPKKSNVRAVAEWCWFVLFASAGGLIVALGFVCLWAGDHR